MQKSGTKDPKPVRDPESSSYLAATFADLVEAESIRRGAHHIRQLTIVGDGAAWIWDLATGKFSEATQIVDIWHAREHLHDLARVLKLMLGDQRDEWLAARLDDLDHWRHRRHLRRRPCLCPCRRQERGDEQRAGLLRE